MTPSLLTLFADTCSKDFFGLIPWYHFLPVSSNCAINISFVSPGGSGSTATIMGLGQIWLIGLAILEDLLRIAAVVAVAFVIYGGVKYLTSQGEPENTSSALNTIIAAVGGLAVTIIAAVFVSFIGNKLG